MTRLSAELPNLLDLAEAARTAEFPAVAFSIAADDEVRIGLCSDDQPDPIIQMSVCADDGIDG